MSLLGLVLAHLNSNEQKSLSVMNVSFAVIVSLCLVRSAELELSEREGERSMCREGIGGVAALPEQ